jgi:hypothetical protein
MNGRVDASLGEAEGRYARTIPGLRPCIFEPRTYVKKTSFGWLVTVKAHAFALVVGLMVWFSATFDFGLNFKLILEVSMNLHLQMALTALRRT